MSMVIELSTDLEQRLRDRAARDGKRPEEMVRQLVESSLAAPDLETDLARFRKTVLASGESEDESIAFFQRAVDEVRAARTSARK